VYIDLTDESNEQPKKRKKRSKDTCDVKFGFGCIYHDHSYYFVIGKSKFTKYSNDDLLVPRSTSFNEFIELLKSKLSRYPLSVDDFSAETYVVLVPTLQQSILELQKERPMTCYKCKELDENTYKDFIASADDHKVLVAPRSVSTQSVSYLSSFSFHCLK
jgi:hypothetical protein